MSSSGSGSTSSSGSSSDDDEKASVHVSSRKGRVPLNVKTKPTKLPGKSSFLLKSVTFISYSYSFLLCLVRDN